ncbi:MAG: hypothetical protein PHX54_01975 [Lentimicrobiaceae bacterium]|nr:hypothetical protein [Lentimicrobiaceae bacterium]
MMKTIRTRTLLIVAIAAVTLINLGAMTTVLVKYRQLNSIIPQQRVSSSEELPAVAAPRAVWMDQVDFDPEQRNQLREYQQAFRKNIRPLIQQINHLNARLLEEMEQEKTDTLEVIRLCYEIGDLKAEMKMQTMYHLMDIHQLARPDQQEQLYPFFREILTQDGNRPHGRGRHRQGRGMR